MTRSGDGMTEILDAVEYKNGAKNNWRSQVWNAIRRHTKAPKDATVIYLPGSRDLDRVAALRRGFDGRNLIAVEDDAAVVETLREAGVNVIRGKLSGLLEAWPQDWRVDFVLADLTCGIEEEVFRICRAWVNSRAFVDSGLVVNLQRGRDKMLSHWFTAMFREHAESKHRAAALWAYLEASGSEEIGQPGAGVPGQFFQLGQNFPSYTSGRVVMDSLLLFATPKQLTLREPDAVRGETKMARRVAAARAIRTRRFCN